MVAASPRLSDTVGAIDRLEVLRIRHADGARDICAAQMLVLTTCVQDIVEESIGLVADREIARDRIGHLLTYWTGVVTEADHEG